MGQVAELAETSVHSYNCTKNGTNCNQTVWLNYPPCRKQPELQNLAVQLKLILITLVNRALPDLLL